MAVSDDMPDDEENGYERQAAKFSKQGFAHLITTIVMLPVFIILFIVGVLMLANTKKELDRLSDIEPENRADIFADKIEDTEKLIQNQYAEYLDKMQDDSIFQLNEKFQIMYEVSKESEQDYSRLLDIYRDATYQLSSKVRGSGEWFYYYDRRLNNFIASQNSREQDMFSYFAEE